MSKNLGDLRSEVPHGKVVHTSIEEMIEELETAAGFLCQGDFPDTTKVTIAYLRSLQTMPGSENLGSADHVVVLHPGKVTEDAVDSIRPYLVAYGDGQHMAAQLRSHAQYGAYPALNVMPKWFAAEYGWVGKESFAALCYHTMIEAQLNPDFGKEIPHLSVEELAALEEDLKQGKVARIQIPKAVQ